MYADLGASRYWKDASCRSYCRAAQSPTLHREEFNSVISSLLGDTAKIFAISLILCPARMAFCFSTRWTPLQKASRRSSRAWRAQTGSQHCNPRTEFLDDHAVVIAATNHPQLLDSAIWRRFPYKIELGAPNQAVRSDLWRHFLFEDDEAAPLAPILAEAAAGLSGADIQMIALAARRQAVIEGHPLDISAVVAGILKAAAGRSEMSTAGHHLPNESKKALALILVREKGISQSDAARLLGVTRQAISGYLKGDDDAAA